MALKGGIVDASGEKISSIRLVTDADANAGLGDALDPIRVDPTGTTVQPVSFSSPQHVIVDSGGGGGTQYAEGTTQATATGTVALGKNSSNVVSALPLTANGLKTDGSAVTQPVSIAAAVTVQQSTAANLKVDLSGTAANATAIKVDGSAVTQPVSLAAETTKVIGTARILGNGGATLDSTVAAGTAPTNAVCVGAQYNNTVRTPSTAQALALQSDGDGALRVNPTGGAGSFKTSTTAGGSGANVTVTVPAGKKWIVKCVWVKLVTSSTVANRNVGIFCSDAATNVLSSNTSSINQTASLTGQYTFGPSIPLSASLVANNATVPYPEIILPASGTIKTSVASIQTGDLVTVNVSYIEMTD